jgi:hypothetical protein
VQVVEFFLGIAGALAQHGVDVNVERYVSWSFECLNSLLLQSHRVVPDVRRFVKVVAKLTKYSDFVARDLSEAFFMRVIAFAAEMALQGDADPEFRKYGREIFEIFAATTDELSRDCFITFCGLDDFANLAGQLWIPADIIGFLWKSPRFFSRVEGRVKKILTLVSDENLEHILSNIADKVDSKFLPILVELSGLRPTAHDLCVHLALEIGRRSSNPRVDAQIVRRIGSWRFDRLWSSGVQLPLSEFSVALIELLLCHQKLQIPPIFCATFLDYLTRGQVTAGEVRLLDAILQFNPLLLNRPLFIALLRVQSEDIMAYLCRWLKDKHFQNVFLEDTSWVRDVPISEFRSRAVLFFLSEYVQRLNVLRGTARIEREFIAQSALDDDYILFAILISTSCPSQVNVAASDALFELYKKCVDLRIPINQVISAYDDQHSERQKTITIRLICRFCEISVEPSWITGICEKAAQIIQKSPDQRSELCVVCDRLVKFIPARPFQPIMITRRRFLWRGKPSFNCDRCADTSVVALNY